MIYFIRLPGIDAVKIGYAKVFERRLSELQAAQPVRFEVIRKIEGPAWVERWFHTEFRDHRIEREWFRFHPEMLERCPPEEKPGKPSRVKKVVSNGSYGAAAQARRRAKAKADAELVAVLASRFAAAIAALRRIAEADPPLPAAEAQREARAAVDAHACVIRPHP